MFSERDRVGGPGNDADESPRKALASRQIDAIQRVASEDDLIEHPKVSGAYVSGRALTIGIEARRLPGGVLGPLPRLLDEFLALYTSTNSFTRLTTIDLSRDRSIQWKPRSGRQTLA